MPTVEQITSRIEACKAYDFFGVETGHLIFALPYEVARPYLKEGAPQEDFKSSVRSSEGETPLATMKSYLPFAWVMANDCRGLSANRSIDHMRALLFLADIAAWESFDKPYQYYGKPQLVFCSEICGFAWRVADDGCWLNNESEPPLGLRAMEKIIAEQIGYAQFALKAAGK